MRYQCKDCGGSSICEHKRVRAYCKICKGSQICAHGRVKSYCTACKSSRICPHGVQRGSCVTCGGVGVRIASANKGAVASNATESAGPFSILRHFEG